MNVTKIISFLLVACIFWFEAAAEPSPNRVVILGTKHNGNKYLNANSLLKIIQRINPDIILLEFDSTSVSDCDIKKVNGAKIAEFLGIWDNPIEYRAARKFKEIKPEICLAPFDIYIPNRREYIAYQRLMEKSHLVKLTSLFNENKLNEADSAQFTQYSKINNALLEKLDSNLLIMNRESLNDTIRVISFLENNFIRQITSKYNELQPYSNWYNSSSDFWEQRNNGMCLKIMRELNANSDRTILILTGLMHKYYLTNFLRKKELEKLCKIIPASEAMNGETTALFPF